MTNCASLAERLYELRPCQTKSLVTNENWVIEKSAASEACLPSFPTMPSPGEHTSALPVWKRYRLPLTDVSRLDHADVVATVADTAHALFGVSSDETRDVGLLGRRASASDDTREPGREVDELGLGQIDTKLERLAVDDEAAVKLSPEEIELGVDVFGGLDCVARTSVVVGQVNVEGMEELTLGDLMNILSASDKLAGNGNARRRLNFVPCKHPYFDAGVTEKLERRLDVLLQLVLDACDGKELEVLLELCDNPFHGFIPVGSAETSEESVKRTRKTLGGHPPRLG